eukprot:Hpha_TRINITY_DN14379_c0_g2::TRINITY_DN14379_c0_g2_i1::g.86621::m.86621
MCRRHCSTLLPAALAVLSLLPAAAEEPKFPLPPFGGKAHDTSGTGTATATAMAAEEPMYPLASLVIMCIGSLIICGSLCCATCECCPFWGLAETENSWERQQDIRDFSQTHLRPPFLDEVSPYVWQHWSWSNPFMPPKQGNRAPVLAYLRAVLIIAIIGATTYVTPTVGEYLDDAQRRTGDDDIPLSLTFISFFMFNTFAGLYAVAMCCGVASKYVLIFDDNTRILRAGGGCFRAWWSCPQWCPWCLCCRARAFGYDEVERFTLEKGADECGMPVINVVLKDGLTNCLEFRDPEYTVLVCLEGYEVARAVRDVLNAFLDARRGNTAERLIGAVWKHRPPSAAGVKAEPTFEGEEQSATFSFSE